MTTTSIQDRIEMTVTNGRGYNASRADDDFQTPVEYMLTMIERERTAPEQPIVDGSVEPPTRMSYLFEMIDRQEAAASKQPSNGGFWYFSSGLTNVDISVEPPTRMDYLLEMIDRERAASTQSGVESPLEPQTRMGYLLEMFDQEATGRMPELPRD